MRRSAADASLIVALILELAEYEQLAHEAVADEAGLARAVVRAHATRGGVDRGSRWRTRRVRLFFHNFSTFVGKPGLYLEDLFVRPAFRGLGLGKRLMVRLAQIAVERDCGRFEWSVLDWNTPAINFYRSLGAVGMEEWTVQRLSGEALSTLAAYEIG